MSDLNSVVLVGRLTRDPELRYTTTGSALCEFGIASNRTFTRKDGERAEEVTFVDVVSWGNLAVTAAEYLKKGRQVAILGTLTQDRWEDKETGQKRSRIRVQATSVQFLGGGSKDGESSEAATPVEDVPAASTPMAPPPQPAAAPQKGRVPTRR